MITLKTISALEKCFLDDDIAPIDPYRTTDGEFFVPSGDAFSVYPRDDAFLLQLRETVNRMLG